jgi:hypothetical protein
VSEERDALVVGGNMAGLAIAYLLGQYGYRTTLVEKAARLGGVDGSFVNGRGRSFDFGMHALDHMRAEFVTKLLTHAVRGRVRRLPKRRAIVLRGHLIPYNAPPSAWPAELRALLRAGPIVDDLGSAPPTRAALGRIYGAAFAAMIFDEALRSYPAECRHLDFGVDESALMVNVYPWFFPRVEREGRADDPHHRYQERVRREQDEHVIYPESGGFAGFAEGLAARAREAGVEILQGAGDLAFDMDPAARVVRSCTALGRTFSARRVYWCGPVGALCGLLGEEAPDVAPERFVLGSFQFARPVSCPYLELIVADPAHPINRASFPGKLHGEPDDLVQLEFAFPKASGAYGAGAEYWLETWLDSLRALGVVQRDNELVEFDLKSFPILYNSFGVDGQPMPELELNALPPTSNLRPVLPTIRKVNINTRLPQYLEFLARDLARG